MLTAEDVKFLEQRRLACGRWPVLAVLLLCGLIGLLVGLFVLVPRLVHPGVVAQEINAGALDQQELELMATFLPVVVLTAFALVIAFVVYGYMVYRTEVRYHQVLQRILGAPAQ